MSNANKLLLQRAVLERLTGRPLGRGALQTQDLIDALCALASVVLEEHPHHMIDAEFVGDAPEPEAGDASATVKVTECQWPGCHAAATGQCGVLGLGHDGTIGLQPACAVHAGYHLATP